MRNLFEGRLLKCTKCGFEFQSRPQLESMFTTVQINELLIDFCPFCWGVPKDKIPKEVKTAHMRWKDEN
jgi:hypothetical protein